MGLNNRIKKAATKRLFSVTAFRPMITANDTSEYIIAALISEAGMPAINAYIQIKTIITA